MNDDAWDILIGLAGDGIIEYHSAEDIGDGQRRHHITTSHGYEVALSDDEVAPFALGATSAEFRRMCRFVPMASDALDEVVARRWRCDA